MTGPRIDWLAEYEREEAARTQVVAARHPLEQPKPSLPPSPDKPDWLTEFETLGQPPRLRGAMVMAEPQLPPVVVSEPAIRSATPIAVQPDPFSERSGGGVTFGETGEGFFSNLASGFARGVRKDLPEQVGNFLQMFNAHAPIPGVPIPPVMVRGAGAALERFGNDAPEIAPRAGSVMDAIKSPRDALDYLGYQIGNVGASSIPSIVAGVIGGPLGAGAASYIQNTGDVRQELEDTAPDVPELQRDALAQLLGVPLAALDQVTESRLAKKLVGETVESIAKRGVRESVKRVAKETGKSVASEGATEGAQEAVQYLGTRLGTGQPIDASELGRRVLEASVAGAAGGGAMGGATQTYSEGRAALQARLRVKGENQVKAPPIVDRSKLDERLKPKEEPEESLKSPEKGEAPEPKAEEPERVAHPAIRTKDGDVITATSHIELAELEAAKEAEDGFTTSRGRFVSREEANRLIEAEDPEGVAQHRKENPRDTQPLDSENIAEIRAKREQPTLQVDSESRYADEEDPEALYQGGVDQARGAYKRLRFAEDMLTSGKATSGRKLTPKQIEGLEQTIKQERSLYHGTLSQIGMAFDSDVQERARREIEEPSAPEPTPEPKPESESFETKGQRLAAQVPAEMRERFMRAFREDDQAAYQETRNEIEERFGNPAAHALYVEARNQEIEPTKGLSTFEDYKRAWNEGRSIHAREQIQTRLSPDDLLSARLLDHLSARNEKGIDYWQKLRAEGATDEDVRLGLGHLFGILSGRTGVGGYSQVKGGQNPIFELEKTKLTGKKLVDRVRKIIGIPTPQEILSRKPSTEIAHAETPTKVEAGASAPEAAPEQQPRAEERADADPVPAAVRGKPSRREAGTVSPVEGERGADVAPGRSDERGGQGVRFDLRGTEAAEPRADDVPREVTAPADARGASEGDGAGRDSDSGRRPDAGRVSERRSTEHVAASNYRITDADAIGSGGAKGKAKANLEAIRFLKQIESENRPATAEEQAKLVKYVGWGGIPQAFTLDNKEFGAIARELRELLTDKEYEAARASTLNAHYTSAPVIRAIHDGLRALGVDPATKPRVLEPSSGVGHFLGLGPQGYRWTAVELDSITGRIAKQLYPEADVQVKGFEQTIIPDNSIDVAIGNVPFGDYPVTDRAYPADVTKAIHDYFFAKTLDKVRPGGIVAFITSSFTLDKKNGAMRRYLSERARLIGAVRLPNTAFKGNAGTEVTTDLIILQKRGERGNETPNSFIGTVTATNTRGETFPLNQYYYDHPEMMLGEMQLAGTMYRADQPALIAPEGQNIEEALRAALGKLPPGTYQPRKADAPGTRNPETAEATIADESVLDGRFAIRNGKLVQRQGTAMVDAKVAKAAEPKVRALTQIRDQIRRVLDSQIQNADEATIERERKELNRLYDGFAKQHGPISREHRIEIKREGRQEPIVQTRYPNIKEFQADPDWPLVLALENYDAETDTAKKTDILTKRVIEPRRPVERVESPSAAIPVVLAESGKVDLERIAQLAGTTPDEAREALRGAIYENPETGDFETADQYLSGNVRAKLKAAKRAGDRLAENVPALEQAIPEDLPPSKIGAQLGSPWIPTTDIERFVEDVFGPGQVKVTYLAKEATWVVAAHYRQQTSAAATTEYGTQRIYGIELLQQALNMKEPTIWDQVGESRQKNPEETIAAQAKQQKLKDRFAKWLWEDNDRATRLARLYNDRYNNIRLRTYDGTHLTLPGAAAFISGKPFALRDHQKNAIWQILQNGNTLLAHVVGAGKTYTMVGAGMEAKRLGLARKPMYVVPNHMLAQFSREFLQMYPTAKLLVATKEDFAKEKRKAFTARVAAENWDAVIMTHRSFEAVPMSPEFEASFIRKELDDLEASIREAKATRQGDLTKLLEKSKKKREARLQALKAEQKKDDLLPFEALGVDMLFVDEADQFKNLNIVSKQQGLGLEGSQRAFDMYLKSQYLDSLNPGRGIVFATGTPIANSVSEMYTMQRYLQPRLLRERGVEHFDAWAATFGDMVVAAELAPDGSGYRQTKRFARFQNMGELAQMFRSVADVQSAEDLNLPRPKLRGGQMEVVSVPATTALKQFVRSLVKRAEAVKGKRVDPSEDNMLKITGDGRKAALDLRMVHLPPEGTGKLAVAATRIATIYHETAALKGAQLVFTDLGTPGEGFNAYDEIRRLLIEQGVKPAEIKYIHEADTDAKKIKLFADVRAGRVRVMLGSTEKMGAGTNVQTRLVAEHHLDAPWRPRDVEQRNGRILRQGNELYDSGKIADVQVISYVTEGSFDAYIWQGLERKAGFIRQALKAGAETRTVEDVGTIEVDYATAKAIASGNPKVMEKAVVDAEVAKLEAIQRSHQDDVFVAARNIKALPTTIANLANRIEALGKDAERAEDTTGDKFRITLGGKQFTKRPDAAAELGNQIAKFLNAVAAAQGERVNKEIGSFAGFPVRLESVHNKITSGLLVLSGEAQHDVEVSVTDSPIGIVQRMENVVKGIAARVRANEQQKTAEERKLDQLKKLVDQPFEHSERLAKAKARQDALARELEEDAQRAARDAETVEGDDDAPDLPDTMYAVSDPLSLAYVLLRDRVAQRKKDREPLVTSSLEEVERRFREAKGIREPGIRERVRQGIEAIRRATRHFKHIAPGASPLHARTNELLLEVEHAKRYAEAVAYDKIAEVTDGLTPGEVDLLTRSLVLNDILKDVEAGLYEGRGELPFGYPDEEAVKADRAKVDAALVGNEKVRDAMDRREKFTTALTRKLVDLDLLDPKVLDDSRYYHRQVMEYVEAQDHNFMGTGAREVRAKRKGFQKQRTGGGDFNTRYEQAEFEWVAQAYRLIHMKEAQREIRQLADIMPQLKAEAKSLNVSRFYEKEAEAAGVDPDDLVLQDDPLLPYRKRMGMASSKLLKLVVDGKIVAPQFDDLITEMADAYQDWRAEMKSRDPADREPFRFDHPRYFAFLNYLMAQDGVGAKEAATFFKAMHEREQRIRTTLGDEYREWDDLVPEGYVQWQPVKGQQFYQGLTIAERVLDQVMAGEKALEQSDLKTVLVAGGQKETWVVPDWLGATMDNLGKQRDMSAVEATWVGGMRYWKTLMLQAPNRLLKYIFNNTSGDLDASILYPKVIRYAPRASADLFTYMIRRQAPDALKRELQEATRLRVIDQGLTVAEIPDVNELPAFRKLVDADPLHFMGLVQGYFERARLLTQLRENILRLAAYRHFRTELEAGRSVGFGASTPASVQAQPTAAGKAAVLARDLLGDYGSISTGGEFLRDRAIPFFSWIEINAKRYTRLFRNIRAEGGSGGRVAGAGAARLALYGAGVALRANVFFLLVNLWNRLMFPDEERELRGEDGRTLHLVLGRDSDGRVRTLRIEGAFADFLEWLDLSDYPADVVDLLRGEKSAADMFTEGAAAPVNRIVSGWEPVTKTSAEMLTGRSFFPDAFHPRVIRDRGAHAARAVTLGWLYDKVTDKPARPGNPLSDLLLYRTDPGEAAYFRIRDKAGQWLEDQNKGRKLGNPTEKENALYYWRKALQWGEPEKAERWLQRYYELGGTRASAVGSIKRAAPLSVIAERDRRRFREALSAEDREALQLAEQWYQQTLRGVRPSRPAAASDR